MLHLQLQPPPSVTPPKLESKPQLFDPPNTLNVSKDSGQLFHQKILYLKSRNINPIKALEINPNLRTAPLATLQSIERYLSSMGIHNPSSIGRILDMHPQLLTVDPFTQLDPVFDFLINDVRIPFRDISKTIVRCPRLLVSDVELRLKPTFEFLRNLGFVGPFKITAQTTVLLVSNVERTLVPKIDYLVGLGLEYDEVVDMVLRSPGLLTFSIENNFKPKTVYFFKEMKGELRDLKNFPQYYSYSLERKIKPRYELLMENGVSMKLCDMLKVSDGEFRVRIVDLQLQSVEGKTLL